MRPGLGLAGSERRVCRTLGASPTPGAARGPPPGGAVAKAPTQGRSSRPRGVGVWGGHATLLGRRPPPSRPEGRGLGRGRPRGHTHSGGAVTARASEGDGGRRSPLEGWKGAWPGAPASLISDFGSLSGSPFVCKWRLQWAASLSSAAGRRIG